MWCILDISYEEGFLDEESSYSSYKIIGPFASEKEALAYEKANKAKLNDCSVRFIQPPS